MSPRGIWEFDNQFCYKKTSLSLSTLFGICAILLLATLGCRAITGIPTPTSIPPTPTPRPQPTFTPLPASAPDPQVLADALALAEQVDIDRLMADVIWLADDARRGRRVGSPEADAVAAWLTERFQTLGLPPFTDAGLTTHSLEFEAPGGAGQNVIAVLPGTQSSGNYVLIGAHYDHLGVTESGEIYNGADDDATGVAAVLEAARILSNASQRPQETIVFVAFSSEELGGQGSQALCQQLADHDLIDDSLLLNLEVLGAIQGTGTFLDVWDERDASTRPLVEAVQAAGQALGIPVQRQGRDPGSDAQVLLACGAPAVSLDVAWSYENHPYIHTPDDNVEHIDQSGLYKAAQVALAAIWLLANDGILD